MAPPKLIDPLEKIRGLLRTDEDVEAGAAVAILLSRSMEGLRALLVKRTVNPSDPWSGDMAFPGGKRHPEDRTLKDTVIRETMEETGIDLRGCRLLGSMEVASSNINPKMVVQPFVLMCDGEPEVKLSGELCDHLWIPLEQLRRSRGVARVRQLDVPAYLVKGEVIWGLTYRMLENLLGLLDRSMTAT